MVRERPATEVNVQRAVVRGVAYLGDLSVYRVQLDSGSVVRVTRPNALGGADARVVRGDEVWLTWDTAVPVVLSE
jgi:putrescine transport system ATP-binding protein